MDPFFHRKANGVYIHLAFIFPSFRYHEHVLTTGLSSEPHR